MDLTWCPDPALLELRRNQGDGCSAMKTYHASTMPQPRRSSSLSVVMKRRVVKTEVLFRFPSILGGLIIIGTPNRATL